ncbi:hypothetical protein [Halorientalis pallida]|uniref:Uncharacterized protein n=1 Tax=Halorientalis pallida TaxID=2479928 RepID=A0A498KXQ7_9EURY|nr:hypothetical protein [Halorientalis pallida]RXK50119.1 hypothetical protein EAF64_06025 [Halorientalis pallida]
MDDTLHRRLTLVVALLVGILVALIAIAYLAWGSDAVIVAVAALCLSLSTWTVLAWRRRGGLLAR